MHAQILAACRAAADLPPIHVECQRVRLASKCLHRLPDLHMAAPLLRELDLSRNRLAVADADLGAGDASGGSKDGGGKDGSSKDSVKLLGVKLSLKKLLG